MANDKDKNIDLGELDFGDMGGDFGADSFDPFGGAADGNSRSPVEEFKDTFKQGVKERMLDPGILRRLVGQALPKGYSHVFNAYDGLVGGISKVYGDNQSELSSYTKKLKNMVDRASPGMKSLLPKGMVEALDRSGDQESFSSGAKDDPLTANLAEMEAMFKSQASDRTAGMVKEAQAAIIGKKRFDLEMSTSLSIGKGIGRLVGYQDTILIGYHRKSLELGFRQLDVMSRLLNSTSAYHAGSATALTGILKNTALPDYVKMHSKEFIAQQMRAKLANTALGKVGTWSKDYFKNITQNASDMAAGALQFKDTLAMGETGGMSKASMVGGMLGKGVGDAVGRYAVNKGVDQLSTVLAPLLAKIPGFEAGGRNIQNLLTGIPQAINDYAGSATKRTGLGAMAEEAFKALITRQGGTPSIGANDLEGLDTPTPMDKLFHKSVTEIIPAYLASSDRWLAQIATGQQQGERTWSFQKDELVDRKDAVLSNISQLVMKGSGGLTRAKLNSILKTIGADTLSEEAQSALRRQLVTDMSAGKGFTPGNYVKLDVWRGEDPDVAEEIIDHVANTFGLSISGEQVIKTDDIHKKFTDANAGYLDLANSMPDYAGRMGVYKNVVGRRSWRDAGLTTFDGLQDDVVNQRAFYDMIANSETVAPNGMGDTPHDDAIGGGIIERMRQQAERARASLNQGVPQDTSLGDLSDNVGERRSKQIEYPDLMNVSDDITHTHLETLIASVAESIQLLGVMAAGQTTDGTPPKPGDFSRLGSLGLRTARGLTSGMTRYLKFAFGLQKKAIVGGFGLAKDTVGAAFSKNYGVKDVHVLGEATPSLTSKNIRLGKYFDLNTKTKITTLSDITGPVVDNQGNERISQEEFDRGLVDGQGESLTGMVGRFTGRVGIGAGKMFAAYTKGTYGLMGTGIKAAFNFAVDQFTQFDAYFPGDTTPRIRSSLLKKNFYRDIEGNVITRLDAIKGAVFDIDGNEIVSLEDIQKYKSFFSRNGSLLFTVGGAALSTAKRLGTLALAAGKGYVSLVKKMYGGMWSGVKMAGRGIKSGLGKLFGFKSSGSSATGEGGGGIDEGLFEVSIEQLKTQVGILKLLQSSLTPKSGGLFDTDGDGDRDNSWTDIQQRRNAAKGKGKGDPTDVGTVAIVDAIDALSEQMSMNFSDLGEQVEEAGEDSLLDTAGDLMGGGKSRRGGKLGRMGKWLKGSRVGRLAGRAGGAIARMAPWAGRAGMMTAGMGGVGSTLMGAGGAILSGAGSLVMGAGSLLAGAASGAVALVGAPVLIGAAVVGGAAYLGYKYYKSSKAKEFPLLYLRMTQYGVSPTDEDRVQKLLALEKIVSPHIQGSGSQLALNSRAIDIPSIFKLFEVEGDEERTGLLLQWISKRFRPVFLAHAGGMFKITGSYDLESSDKAINDSALEGFLGDVNLPNMAEVYDDDDTSPFSSDLDTDADDVNDAIIMVREKRDARKKEASKTPLNTDLATRRGMMMGDGKDGATKLADKQTLGVTAGGSSDAADIRKGLITAGGLSTSGGVVNKQTGVVTSNHVLTMNIPLAVRYKTYGLKVFIMERVAALQKLEEVCWPLLTFEGTQVATLNGNRDELEERLITILAPPHEAARVQVINWIRYRFLPVLLQYAVSCRRRYNGQVQMADKNLTGKSMFDVLTEVSETKSDTPDGEKSVWGVLSSPWQGEEMETQSGTVKIYLDSLDKGSAPGPLTVEGLKAADRDSSANTEFRTKMDNLAAGRTRTDANTNVSSQGGYIQNYMKKYTTGQVTGGVAGQSTTGMGDGSLLMQPLSSMGSVVQHPGGGSDGDINSIPEPTADGWAGVGPTIIAAAKMQGFDPAIAASVAAIESSFRVKVGAGTSSAKGLYQFIDGTWDAMMAKYGKKFGIAPGTTQYDGRANAILGVRYLIDNYNYLKSKVPGAITDTSLYAAHFLGPAGASKLLSGNSNAPASSIADSGVINANPGIFTDGNGRLRTVGGVVGELDRRMKKARSMHTLGSSAGATETAVVTAPTGSTASPGAGPDTPSVPTMLAPMDTGTAGMSGASNDTPTAPTAAPSLSDITSRTASAAGVGVAATAQGGMGNETDVPTDTTSVTPAAPVMSTTTVAATRQQSTTMAEQAATTDTVNTAIGKQLMYLGSIDGTLKDIYVQLSTLGKSSATYASTAANQVAAPPVAAPAPAPKRPVSTTRQNAVT